MIIPTIAPWTCAAWPTACAWIISANGKPSLAGRKRVKDSLKKKHPREHAAYVSSRISGSEIIVLIVDLNLDNMVDDP
jgi:hypothetical protein